MRLYAQLPARAVRQVAADVLAVVVLLLAVRAAHALRDAVLQLAEPGRRLQTTGDAVGRSLRQAASQVGNLPLVGDDVRGPLDQAGVQAGTLSRAGTDLVTAVQHLATLLQVVVIGGAILLLLLTWLPVRVRFVRSTRTAQRFVDAEPDLDLFALRAMAHQPMHRLARISDDPAGAWRRGDRTVIHQLATLELKAVGLRPPRLP
ncbi:hypothetical protein [Angustibacter aerolatus]